MREAELINNIEEKDTDSEEQRLIHQTEDIEKNIV